MNGRKLAGQNAKLSRGRLAVALLCGTILCGMPQGAIAQSVSDAASGSPTIAPQGDIIRSITVNGAQRLEPQTILSYIKLRVGEPYTQAAADQAIKDLYATELFSSVSVRNDNGAVTIDVVENPIINRIILEGNKRIKDDKIRPEIKLAPRQIFTRSKVRADVARIIELYKRQGRFAATVEPKMVQLPQNRVDIVFEINEGPKSKVKQINIIGNEKFSDGKLRSEMVTRQDRLQNILSSNTSYDPDRMAFDQQKLRQFYLTEGYADFRVVSAVAELTPDKKDFIITYVVEEGERYKFGDVSVDSQLRDFDSDALSNTLAIKEGDWYNAKTVEDTVEGLSELAGTYGYAFADISPRISRNKDELTMDVTFVLSEAPRVYIESINVNGNTLTEDRVIRREFRVAEGDAFNSLQVKRSTNRIKSLGFFQENFEIEQKDGSQSDRIILEANVEEQNTGELSLSAGFSSLERFILAGSITQRNFRGKGQTLSANVNWSRYSRSAGLSFTEPYLFDRNIFFSGSVYRRDLNSFNFVNDSRNTTYEQSTTGLSLRLGTPITEYMSLVGSYTLNYDNVTIDENTYFADLDGDGISTCEPLIAGRYLCDALGKRTSSILGLTWVYNALDNSYRPTNGISANIGVEYAGLGGSVKYVRARGKAAFYKSLGSGFIFSLRTEGGYINGLGSNNIAGEDNVRLTDRFFLGEPDFRGFDIRGVGPRVQRSPLVDEDGDGIPEVITDPTRIGDDALGGKAYYLARTEIEIPLGSGARELGIRPSVFLDVGSLFNLRTPTLSNECTFPDGCQIPQRNSAGELQYAQAGTDADGNPTTTVVTDPVGPDGNPNTQLFNTIAPFQETFLGDSWKPRVSVGIGANWNSPFGPLRLDFAHVLVKQEGDDTKRFIFNVGTQFQ